MPCPDVPPPPPPPLVSVTASVNAAPLVTAGVLVDLGTDDATASAGVVSEPVTGSVVAAAVVP